MVTYFEKIHTLLQQIEENETQPIKSAAEKMAQSIEAEGMIHLFGCGHSHLLAEDILYRAGGLAAVKPILHEPLMLHEGAVTSSRLEKMPDYASNFMREEDIQPGDVVMVISTSGRNPVPIDVALIARQAGASVIGLTSKAYRQAASRHPSGKLLADCVDVVIDNHVPYGDGTMTNEKLNTAYGPVSTVLGSAIINQIIVQVTDLLIEKGIDVPVFKSGNIDGSEAHNQALVEKYKKRNPLLQ